MANSPTLFSLHGHAFDVVKSISGPENYINPPRRDVVGVGGKLSTVLDSIPLYSCIMVLGSEVRIRFKADNPGPWFLHCHMSVLLSVSFRGLTEIIAVTGILRRDLQSSSPKLPLHSGQDLRLRSSSNPGPTCAQFITPCPLINSKGIIVPKRSYRSPISIEYFCSFSPHNDQRPILIL